MYSRRHFLKTTAGAAAASVLPSLHVRAAVRAMAATGADSSVQRISDGWEFLKATLGGPWEVWHSAEVAVWEPVKTPHCFNAYDACDPDVQYYQGNGWYRTHVAIANPYPGGRTLLHFEGAGQAAAVYVGESLVGKHTGGYDEFVFDITDQIKTLAQTHSTDGGKPKKADGVPIAVLCDNSRDLDRMPSDLSDFSLYGGMYRHVNLVYVPPVSLETVYVKTNLPTPQSTAQITIVGTLYNPAQASDAMEITVQVVDAQGASIHESKKTLKPWNNCPTAELFVNGKSLGVKQRNMNDFPAAGLRWTTPFMAGKNHLRVVAQNHGKAVTDEIEFVYQTEKWAAPDRFLVKEISRGATDGRETVTIEATLHDAKGVLCLDAKNQIRYSVAGTARLIDNRGTAGGSRVVQLSNGRSRITIFRNGGGSTLAVTTPGVPTAFRIIS